MTNPTEIPRAPSLPLLAAEAEALLAGLHELALRALDAHARRDAEALGHALAERQTLIERAQPLLRAITTQRPTSSARTAEYAALTAPLLVLAERVAEADLLLMERLATERERLARELERLDQGPATPHAYSDAAPRSRLNVVR